MSDPYEVLGVERDADSAVIKRRRRDLAKEHHSDKGGDDETMAEINAAADLLLDPEARAAYDRGEKQFRRPGSLDGEALGVVAQMFATVAREQMPDPSALVRMSPGERERWRKHGINSRHRNLLAMVREKLGKERSQILHGLLTLDEEEAYWRDVEGRIAPHAEPLLDVARKALEGAAQMRAVGEHRVLVLEKALELAKGWTYRADPSCTVEGAWQYYGSILGQQNGATITSGGATV